ncbi:LuxR family transcriptional regulator [Streptomyces sp. 8K308]|uniref:AAA family ATPase n=1 Tax=Streptomyces sp. 8K308 TaxID=2530388 RepID=UPI001404527D|nr:LuxR family transcriptional regulator [Streptomyces sp. 8K308]
MIDTIQPSMVRRVLAEGWQDRSCVVLLEGGAGSGKSLLLDAVAEHASREGAVVLRAAAREGDAGPFSVLRQLLLSPSLPAAVGQRLARLLRGAGHWQPTWRDTTGDGRPHLSEIHEFSQAVRELAEERPLLLAVDDLGHADEASLELLLQAIRRCRGVRLVLVATKSLGRDPTRAAFHTELLRQPHFRRLRVRPLNEAEVAAVVATYPIAASREFTRSCYAISGGNPLVLRALLDDHLLATGGGGSGPDDGVVVGEAYAEAILTCVHRAGPRVSEIAAGLAVLGESASPERVGRLLDILPATVPQALEVLAASGVLDGCRFRHPNARIAVLDRLDATRRAALHRRAAALLYAAGAPGSAIADHLVAVPGAAPAWAPRVFEEAADLALAEGRVASAIGWLERAQQASVGTRLHAHLQHRLAAVARRLGPSTVDQYLAGPLVALRAGELAAPHFAPLIRLLAGQGRMDEAREALERLHTLATGAGAAVEAKAHLAALYVSSARPVPRSVSPAGVEQMHQTVMPWSMVEGGVGASADAVAAAEDLLRLSELTDATFDAMVGALKLLAQSDQPSRALHWCEELLARADLRRAPGWRVVVACVGGGAALRMCRLAEAERLARHSLGLIHERDDVFTAGPISLLVQVATLAGRHEEATRLLNRPMPEALQNNLLGIHYRRARAVYYRATQRNHSALRDSLATGGLAQRWGLDHAIVLPWRAEAARTLLAMDDREPAERYARDQIERTDQSVPRGRRLVRRLGAALAPVADQPARLTELADELAEGEDRLELLAVLLDLAEAHGAVGDRQRAAEVAGRAVRLARESGALALAQRGLRLIWAGPGRPAAGTGTGTGAESLSDSERRVASLAAAGETNRAIAGRLYITMSTVEQHLTRVYRKLGIQGRHELPVDLWPDAGQHAPDHALHTLPHGPRG